MKRILQRVLSIVLVFTLVCSSELVVFAETSSVSANSIELVSEENIVDSGKCGDNVSWALKEEGTLTISGTGEMNDSSFVDFCVTPWDAYKTEIKEVIIEDGVTDIAHSAFTGCTNLVSVNIGNTVKVINGFAFEGCSKLESVKMSANVEEIWAVAFQGCTSLKNIDLPESLQKICTLAFGNCKSLEKLVFLNPNTEFYACEDGLCPKTTVISGYVKSTAHDFASKYGYEFEMLKCEDHTYGEWIADTESSCTETGSKHKECTVCGDIVTEDIEVTEHSWNDDYTVDKEATCKEAGSKSIHCVNCSEVKDVTEIQKVDHSYDDGVVTTEPTTSTEGIKTYTCSACGDTKEETIPVIENDNFIDSGFVENEKGGINWSIDENYHLLVEGTGDFSNKIGSDRAPWYEHREKIISAKIDVTDITDTSYMFYLCERMNSVDVSGFDTSKVKNMSNMFAGCKIQELDLSSFDTGNVTDMSYMFQGCWEMTDLDVSSFDTSNVTNMQNMFNMCFALKHLEISNFDTRNVENMYWMFAWCEALDALDVSSFNTNKVSNMAGMFKGCTKIKELNVSQFNTENVTDMSDMFSDCESLEALDLSPFDTGNVTDMSYMFSACHSLTELNVSSFDTSNTIQMMAMFASCEKLEEIDLSNFDMMKTVSIIGAGYTGDICTEMSFFYNCNSLKKIQTPINCSRDVELPRQSDDDKWYQLENNIEIDLLPQNTMSSITLVRRSDKEEHNWNTEYTVDTEASCTEEGSKSIHCADCSAIKDETVIEAKGHSYGEWIVIIDASCTKEGHQYNKCVDCGDVVIEKIPATGHRYGSYKTTTKATFGKAGKQTASCAKCGTNTTKTISAVNTPILSYTSHTYNEKVKTPIVTVKNASGTKLTKDTHYTVSYASGRKNVGKYGVTITLKGSKYSGKKTIYFTIKPQVIDASKVTLSTTSYTYNGKVNTPTVIVKNSAGAKLTKDTHYTVSYASGRKNVGTYTVKVTMKGNYSGTITKIFKIKPQTISSSKVTLSTTSYTYNGKVNTPTVIVKNSAGAKLTKDTHYTVSYASGRKNVGTYTVKVTMKGNYSGTITKSFKINPKGVSISSLSKASKAFTVKWNKPSSANQKQMTGYQIRYSTSSKMTSPKTVTVTSKTATSKKISRLEAKKTYYVQLRTYKTIGSTKYYSG